MYPPPPPPAPPRVPPPAELAQRVPPHNPDAERGVLGGLLRDPDSIPAVQEVLAPAHFYFDAHQKIYAAVCELVAAAKPVDLVLLYNQLQLAGHLADAGGHLYLAQLWEAVPTGANVEYHARLVREAATVRALIHASNETLRDAYDRVGAADELVGAAERRVMEVARAGLVGEVGLMAAAVDDAFARLDARAAGGGLAVSGVPSGFSDLDHLTAGFQDGDLVVVAARPSVGKTAFGLNLARHAVVDESLAVLFFSLEMGKAELAERLLAAQARVDSHRIRKGAVDSAEIARLMDAGDALRRTRFYIDDTPNRSMTQIAATARRVHRKEADRGGLKLVIVDYLQLVEPESRRDPRHEQVGQISRRLKHLARELRVPEPQARGDAPAADQSARGFGRERLRRPAGRAARGGPAGRPRPPREGHAAGQPRDPAAAGRERARVRGDADPARGDRPGRRGRHRPPGGRLAPMHHPAAGGDRPRPGRLMGGREGHAAGDGDGPGPGRLVGGREGRPAGDGDGAQQAAAGGPTESRAAGRGGAGAVGDRRDGGQDAAPGRPVPELHVADAGPAGGEGAGPDFEVEERPAERRPGQGRGPRP
jgi:replicative DNA helicase